jgi:hypothetical protein
MAYRSCSVMECLDVKMVYTEQSRSHIRVS